MDGGDPALAKAEGYLHSRAGRPREALAAFWAALGPGARPDDYLDAAYAAQDKLVQQGAEAFYQPRALARDGRSVQVFAQAFETLGAPRGWDKGGRTFQPSLGVRAKVLTSQNLVLGIQRVLRSTAGTPADWLYTAAYSADQGVDLQGGRRAWTYASLFAETAYFQGASRSADSLEARLGRTWCWPGTTTTGRRRARARAWGSAWRCAAGSGRARPPLPPAGRYCPYSTGAGCPRRSGAADSSCG